MGGPNPVAEFYDQATELMAKALGGNIHLGYWAGDHDDSPLEEATDHLTDLVAEHLALAGEAHVLDAGCGSGKATLRIARAARAHVTGVTISAHQAAVARARADQPEPGQGSAEFHHMDLRRLTLPDAAFDAAYAIESLVHVENPSAALAQIARVCRPGARFVIADACLNSAVPEEHEELVASVHELFRLAPLRSHREWADLVGAAGFEVEALLDLTGPTRRTFGLFTALLREHAAATPRDAALADGADLISRYAGLSAVGYLLMVATRRTGSLR
jgi:avermectin B 5-O-methyltransferase